MSSVDKQKEVPKIAVATGTAVGTSSIIDTSGYTGLRMNTWTTGTVGSVLACVYVNAGTTPGTASTTMPDLLLRGSHLPTTAGVSTFIPGMTSQAVITHGTSAGSYVTSYTITDADA